MSVHGYYLTQISYLPRNFINCSALAVIAERDDLIARIFGGDFSSNNNPYGIVQVNLFLDGFWRRVTMGTHAEKSKWHWYFVFTYFQA